MDDVENQYNEAIAKAQEALEELKENGGTDLKTQIRELKERNDEIEASKEAMSEDFKQLCRDFVAIESEYGEFMELKCNLEEAKEAFGVENASLREIRDAIQAKCEELQTENSNLKGLVEAASDIKDECELVETECESLNDAIAQLEADIEKEKSEHADCLAKYKKRRKKLKKLLILKGISEWNSSDDDSD